MKLKFEKKKKKKRIKSTILEVLDLKSTLPKAIKIHVASAILLPQPALWISKLPTSKKKKGKWREGPFLGYKVQLKKEKKKE